MNLLPLAERLQAHEVGKMGQTIYINMLPIDVPNAVLLRNGLSGTLIDHELPGYTKTQFQVIVRAPGYQQGYNFMKKVTEVITLNNEAVGMYHFNYCRPHTEPIVFPLSAGNLLEFSVHFDVSCYKVT